MRDELNKCKIQDEDLKILSRFMYALKVIIMGLLDTYESTCEFSVFKER